MVQMKCRGVEWHDGHGMSQSQLRGQRRCGVDGRPAWCSVGSGGRYLEYRGCMLEAVVRCNARVSTVAWQHGSRLAGQQDHRLVGLCMGSVSSSVIEGLRQTRWHGEGEAAGGEAQRRDTSRRVEHGIKAGQGSTAGQP
jgi:hypothetical protein